MSSEKGFCPECGIGLNNKEISLCFCQNCKANWEDEHEESIEDEEI